MHTLKATSYALEHVGYLSRDVCAQATLSYLSLTSSFLKIIIYIAV